jgi:glycosyltransferase involved in cell wall biosynthesis
MSRLTILMPVYNGEQFLRETMDSVLNQTYSDFLFLIINDGSTDSSEDIIKSYSDPRIIYRKNEKNLGLVSTLNKGIDLVETEFLARMDADDLWAETKLEKQIKLLDSRPEVGICGTSIHKFGAFEGDFIFPVENDGLKVGFLFYCCMSHPSIVYRMSFLKESGIRYRVDYFPAEDYKMWIDCLEKTQIYNIPEVLVYYRQHSSQITQDSNALQIAKTNKIRLEVLDRVSTEFTDEEKEFHLKVFVAQNICSVSDYKKCANWCKLIQLRNKEKLFYISPEVLSEGLKHYLVSGYKGYVVFKYFPKFNIPNAVRYVSSLEWRYLSLRMNVMLLLRSIFYFKK